MTCITFAYYCSGHGYGHATRVSAVATHLRLLADPPIVHIISSAPKHVFDQAVSNGSLYRYAEIDPVIVQPLAYQVDRKKSVEVLRKFLDKEDQKIEEEVVWLRDNGVDCVLSDAAYLPCKAANVAGIPSALITNFTFDSVYSYLSIAFPRVLDESHSDSESRCSISEDEPIPVGSLTAYVNRLFHGYRCAQLLVRLPGDIPIPSFSVQPSLPSHLWTNAKLNTFIPDVRCSLSSNVASSRLHPDIPFPESTGKRKPLPRKVIQSPLIVRHPSSDAYTLAGRERILQSVGVPAHLRASNFKVLIVSFGGQTFRKPNSRTHSRSQSPSGPRSSSVTVSRTNSAEYAVSCGSMWNISPVHITPQVAADSHILVPGAPPAKKGSTTGEQAEVGQSKSQPEELDVTPQGSDLRVPQPNIQSSYPGSLSPKYDPQFLPDGTWIAIVCGATAKKGTDDSTDDELPENFFLAPRDVYMPDLTAVADVLLGKLGYGTVSECVDAGTPFVFVPRPLFVEEHGLRALLEREGAGIELSRSQYEAGDWAAHVAAAWEAGREIKMHRRARGNDDTRKKEGEQLAGQIVDWVREWQRAESLDAAKGTLDSRKSAIINITSERSRRFTLCDTISPHKDLATPPASPIRIQG